MDQRLLLPPCAEFLSAGPSFLSGGSQLEVKLVLLWKHNMHIEYLAAASWPLEPAKRTTRVEVTMEGSYDILHDISCTQRKPITSPYRTSVIRRFWNTLQRCTVRPSLALAKVACQTLTRRQPLCFQYQPNGPDVGAPPVFQLHS